MRVLVVWELGGGFGHVASLAGIAQQLLEGGHEPVFVLRDLSLADSVLGAAGYRSLQAPVWLPRTSGLPPAANYAELLCRYGYRDSAGLAGVARAWRALYELVAPDALLLNHAPTALLAARGLGIRTVAYGTGFECPPPITPMPGLPVAEARLRESEERVLACANEMLSRLGLPTLRSFADIARVDEQLLCTFRELDPYRQARLGPQYLGPLLNWDNAAEPVWPAGRGPRVYAFLDSRVAGFQVVLSQLAESGCRVLLRAPGVAADQQPHYAGPGMAFTEPLNVMTAAGQADAILSHGGHGTTAAALLAGCPQLLLPQQGEQALVARAVAHLGAGLLVRDAHEVGARLLEVTGQPDFRRAARVFARSHEGFTAQQPIATLVRRVTAVAPRAASRR